MSSDEQNKRIIDLRKLSTMSEAMVLAAVLKEAGIPCSVSGASLQDEFAMAQRMLRTGPIALQIREGDREAAEKALAAAREVGRQLSEGEWKEDEDADPATPPESPQSE